MPGGKTRCDGREVHRDVKRFLAYAENVAVTKETVIEYKKYLQKNYAVRSVNSMLASINSFVKAAFGII